MINCEDQLRHALKRIAELESQQAADREELRVTKRALEIIVSHCQMFDIRWNVSSALTVAQCLDGARKVIALEESNPAAAEGGR